MNWLLPLLIVAATPAAPIDPRHPDAVEIFHCGFEEKSDRDLDGWPDKWTRKRGPNYPAYLPIRIVEDATPEGQFAVRIGLNGGAAMVSTPPIEVDSAFSYVLEACLRTEGLKFDRAMITLSFLDSKGAVTETFSSEEFRDVAEWRKVRLGPLVSASDQVRTAVIRLHLKPLGDQADLRGAAYFDDLWLGRLPRMSLHTNRADNIYTDASQVDITCNISGIFEHNPVMRFELVDINGQMVGEPQSRQLETKAPTVVNTPRSQLNKEPVEQDKGFVDSLHWKPRITQPGFYRARVTLEGSTEKVLERQLTLAVVGQERPAPGGEFGWSLPKGDQPLPYAVLAGLLPQMGLSWTKFPVWLDERQVRKLDELVDFAERLSLQGVASVGILADPPAEVRPSFGDTPNLTAAAIFSTDPEIWYKSLEPSTTRLSMQVHWWQLGHDDDTSFVGDSQLARRVAGVKKELEQFGQRAHMGLTWKILYQQPSEKQATWSFLSLTADPPLTPAELAQYLPPVEGQKTHRWLTLEPLSRDEYSRDERASDLVHRMVAAKKQGAQAIFVPNPFDARHGLMNEDGTPSELLLPWRTAALALSGAKFVGSIVLPEGSNNLIFSRDGEMVMVVWNASDVEERVFLGDNIKQINVWGRAIEPRQEDHHHVVPVGPLPSFLVGLSEPILRWIMEVSFEKAQLPSVFGTSHANGLHIKNFFPQGTSGQVRLHTPDIWQTSPKVMNLKLAAGEEGREPFTIRLPFDATNGKYPIRIDFDMTADKEYHFSVYRELEVGLGDVVIEMTSHLNANGDLEVEQYFTNKTDQLLSFKCSLFAPDRRRLVSQVTRLGPQRDTKRYRFPNGKELIGKTLSLRAEEIGGERTFNYRLIAKE